jgi:hypothetical protein
MPPVRFLLAAMSAAGVALAAVAGVGAGGCGTDAVGIEACEAIENARCDAAVACRPDWDPAYCKDYYRDQCLHGIENAEASPSQEAIDACVAAIGKVQGCAQTGVATAAECAIPLVDGADPGTSPCTLITVSPELMKACSFVATEPATASASSSSTTGSGGAGGQGGSGGAGTGGSGGAGAAGGSGGTGGAGGSGGSATGGTGGTGGAAGGGGQGGTGG